jgi:DNA end-binding protein Ku
MGSTDRVALGRFVLRTKEYLVAVRVRDGLLSLTTMLFPDEIRAVKGIDTGARKPAKESLAQAVKLVEALGGDFDPKDYKDEHNKRLRKIVKDKEKGGTIEAPEDADEPQPASDLMEALRASMKEIRGKG